MRELENPYDDSWSSDSKLEDYRAYIEQWLAKPSLTHDISSSSVIIPKIKWIEPHVTEEDDLGAPWSEDSPFVIHKDPSVFSDDEFDIKETFQRMYASEKMEFAVMCSEEKDLNQNHILKCLSIMKSKLMMKCLPIRLDHIECEMTPAVKENMIIAYKKLDMYGKKPPIIARFDEYGRRLSDEIRIDTLKGMNIKIIDPDTYGEFYIKFKGIGDYFIA